MTEIENIRMILLIKHIFFFSNRPLIKFFLSATRFKITVEVQDSLHNETGAKKNIYNRISLSLFTFRYFCQSSAQLPSLASAYFITWHGGEGISFNLVRDLAGVPWRHCSRLYTVRRRRATQKDGSCFFKSYLWFRCAIGVLILSCIDCLLVFIERFVTPAQC